MVVQLKYLSWSRPNMYIDQYPTFHPTPLKDLFYLLDVVLIYESSYNYDLMMLFDKHNHKNQQKTNLAIGWITPPNCIRPSNKGEGSSLKFHPDKSRFASPTIRLDTIKFFYKNRPNIVAQSYQGPPTMNGRKNMLR